MVNGDEDGYLAVTDQFDSAEEAFAAMTRVTQMLAETQGVSAAEMLAKVGIMMAAYDEGLGEG
mgnify:CR=1 FL=1